jgi:hypothetical protein
MEDPASVAGSSDDLRAHLSVCPACAQFAEQLGRTWQLLGTAPEVSLSPGFARSVLSRAQADKVAASPSWATGRVAGWQWMTVGAAAMILAFILAPGIMNRDAAQPVTAADQWDESFLQALGSSLEEPDYLPAYDAWAEEAAASESPSETPEVEENPGGVRHGKS